MKKVISILITFILAVTIVGCSASKSNEKVDNTKAQEQEQVINTESEDQDKEEKNTENKEKVQDTLVLKGKIVGYGGGNDVGNTNTILLDEKLNIKGKEVDRIWLEDESITDLIPRKYFTYYFPEGLAIKDEFIEKIPLEVEIDVNSIEFVDFYTFATTTKVISLDGEKNPIDKSNDDYPIEYYEEVFNSIWGELGGQGFVPEDVKECKLYKDSFPDDMFRISVDKILEAGLYINMLEGDYEIDTEKRYSEEGVGE